MATMRFAQLLSLFSFVLLAIAAPSTLSPSSLITRTDSDVVKFAIDLTWKDYDATGGVVRKAILTNGTIPGPPLKLKVGQSVEFMVHNNLPFGTSVHFHGIGQLNTPWSDGVTGLTQRPIPAGASYLYKWKADEAGTYFYHAHHKGQMMDGLYGAIIIEADDTTQRPFSAISSDQNEVKKMLAAEAKNQPVFISDWSQYTFDDFFKIQQAANIDNACTDSIIVNGKGSVFCQSRADIDAFTAPQLKTLLQTVNPPQLTNKGCLPPNLIATQGNFTFNLASLPQPAYYQCTPSTGETSKINVKKADGYAVMTFINPGGFSLLKFTIDNHKMWVYGVSGNYVKPQQVDQVVVGNGDRYSVLIKLDQQAGTYKINVANAGLNQQISGYASLVYDDSTTPAAGAVSLMNYAGINKTAIVVFQDFLAAPFNAIKPAATADTTYSFNIKKLGHPWEWTLSGTHAYNMSLDDQTPLLYQDPNKIPASDLILKTKYDQWVDLIIKIQGPLAQPHPLHKHSNKAFVLGAGKGAFPYATVAEAVAAMPAGTFNLENPPYRDTYSTIPAEGSNAWMVLRYKADHPGVWAFHCHMQTHFSGGMAVVLMDAPEKFPTFPPEYQQGNGCSKDSPDYHDMSGSGSGSDSDSDSDSGSWTNVSKSTDSTKTSSSNVSGSGSGAGSSSAPAASIAPFKGAAISHSFSYSVVISALFAALIGLSL